MSEQSRRPKRVCASEASQILSNWALEVSEFDEWDSNIDSEYSSDDSDHRDDGENDF